MSQLNDRGKAFRAAIASFIEARRAAKLKGKSDDAGTAAKYEYEAWLADAASRAHNLQVVTHPIKFTQSAIKGASSVHIGVTNLVTRDEIGTHSVEVPEEDFAISDAKHLDVYSLLKEVVAEKRLLDWFREDDPDLTSALDDDPARAAALMDAFRQVFRSDEKLASHPLAKQVYWLKGQNPSDDDQYHLLQPMFSSSLEHAVHGDIRSARDAAFAARGTRKQKPTFADHSTYPGLVARTIGGSNAQNVSPQNKTRGGVNYLLPSLPPPAWRHDNRTNVLRRETIFDVFLWFGGVRELVDKLRRFLRSNPDPTVETRERREAIEQAIGQELAMFGVAARAAHPAGWTRDDDCRLPHCERLWLDPDRVDLPNRADPTHPEWAEDDTAFKRDYDLGRWPDEVAERFGDWLNARLRDAGLTAVSLPERNHWARQAILEVVWPVPLQRRAQGGAA